MLPVVLVIFAFARCSGAAVAPSGPDVDPNQLPGIQVGPEPWPAELEHLGARLTMLEIPALRVEGHRMDLHVRLSVFIDGKRVTVPSGIGLNGIESNGRMSTGFVSPLHTHDALGFVHIHAPTIRGYTLGQAFDVWGVRFTASCVGGHCNDGDQRVRVFVDGKLRRIAEPRLIPLEDKRTIAVTYSTSEDPPRSPKF